MYSAFTYRSPPFYFQEHDLMLCCFSLTVNIVSLAVLWGIKLFLCSQLRFLLAGGEHFALMW